MSSTANLQTDTLGVQVQPADVRRQASLTLADHATGAAELLMWLDMFGLPPCERRLRSYNPKQYRKHAEGKGT